MSGSTTLRLSPVVFRRLGLFAICGAFAFALLVTTLVVWRMPTYAPILPALFLAGIGAWYVFQKPLLNLAVVFGLLVLILGHDDGTQLTEVVFGLYYLAYLGHWFVTRVFLMDEPVFIRREERVLIVFLVLMTLTPLLTILLQGAPGTARGEWVSLSLLAFYFPVREAVVSYKRGIWVVVGGLLWIGLFVLVRNVFNYQEVILSATYAYQISSGRAVTNEGPLLTASVLSLVFVLFSRRRIVRYLGAAGFAAFFGGLLLTQSRGYWLAFIAGALLLLILSPGKYRWRLVNTGVVAAGFALGAAFLLLGDFVTLVVTGMIERFVSIGTASTADISLVNRFQESAMALSWIAKNPIVGYGIGFNYAVFDIIYDSTLVKSFIHNGYIALWFKFGIWGFGMLLYFIIAILRRAIAVMKSGQVYSTEMICCAGVATCIGAFAVSANTSNPFYLNDMMFLLGILSGLAGGCSMRHDRSLELSTLSSSTIP
jgi:O-antigen ligase